MFAGWFGRLRNDGTNSREKAARGEGAPTGRGGHTRAIHLATMKPLPSKPGIVRASGTGIRVTSPPGCLTYPHSSRPRAVNGDRREDGRGDGPAREVFQRPAARRACDTAAIAAIRNAAHAA